MSSSHRFRRVAAGLSFLCLGASAFAGFASTEAFLPAVGRVAGKNGAEFYTTIWATNLTGAPISFTFDFLKTGQANTNPASFTDTLAPGETKVYENVVEAKLGLTDALGAARITSTGEILVAERIYNQPPGADPGDTEGLFFAGVPRNFSISAGQSASIQGINQGGSEDFRYNFALVETAGGSADVDVQVFDGAGTLLGQKAFPLSPYEQIQPGVGDVVTDIQTTNARITATVTGGTGSVLLAGAQVANVSQDSSGFEMSFRDDILGSGGGTAGVTSLNSLTGAVTLAAGSNVTLNKSGQTITIATSDGGGGFTLPYAHTTSSPGPLFSLTNGNPGGGGIDVTIGAASGGFPHPANAAIYGDAAHGYGVIGATGEDSFVAGVYGTSKTTHAPGVWANNSGDGLAVEAIARGNGNGVYAYSVGAEAIVAETIGSGRSAVSATSETGDGVTGFAGGTSSGSGVAGVNDAGNIGIYGRAKPNSNKAGFFDGGITVTNGSKSFVEPHPTDPTKEIRYVCLEGPESGTYFRGSGRIVGGLATIDVPEDFRIVSSPDGLTVQLTPVGDLAVLAVMSQNLDRIVVRGSNDVAFHYLVNGIRKSEAGGRPIEDNVFFVPASANDPALTRPLPEETFDRLVGNGTLNPDGTINLETARRLGWDRSASWKAAEARKKNAIN